MALATSRSLGATLALTLSAAVVVSLGQSASSAPQRTTVNRHLDDARITESSGLAVSSRHSGVLWTHNDSGGGPRVYAVGEGGGTRAMLDLAGVKARDWEDMAAGPNNTLWIGDIGDNRHRRTTVEVYRIKEPRTLRDASVKSTKYSFKYPDGKHNAEALMVRPGSGRIFIATKAKEGAALYRAPKHLSTNKVNRLKRRGKVPGVITGGAFAPEGGGFVLRSYGRGYRYNKVRGTARNVDLPSMKQGESITYTRSGNALLAGTEGGKSPVWWVPGN